MCLHLSPFSMFTFSLLFSFSQQVSQSFSLPPVTTSFVHTTLFSPPLTACLSMPVLKSAKTHENKYIFTLPCFSILKKRREPKKILLRSFNAKFHAKSDIRQNWKKIHAVILLLLYNWVSSCCVPEMRNHELRPNFKGEGCVRLAVSARLTL